MNKILLILSLIISLSTLQGQTDKRNNNTVIAGYFDDEQADTIKLEFFEQRIAGTQAGSIIQTCILKRGYFKFLLPMKGQFSYVSIYPYRHSVLAFDYLVKKGDSNFIYVNMPFPNSNNRKPVLHFSGTNSGGFKARYTIDSAYVKAAEKAEHLSFSTDSLQNDVRYLFRKVLPVSNTVASILKAELEKIKIETDPEIYEILETDYLFQTELHRLNWFAVYRRPSFRHPDSSSRILILKNYYNSQLQNITATIPVSLRAKLVSRYYMEYNCLDAIVKTIVKEDKRQLQSVYPLIPIIEQADKNIREKFLTCIVADLGTYNDISGKDSLIQYAKNRINSEYLRNIITGYHDKAMKGRDAFVFSLEDKNGKLVSLLDFKGKTVLLDFWFTGCFGCTQVAKGLKQVKDYFAGDTSIVFISISTDKDRSIWLTGLKSGIYTDGRGIDLYTMGKGHDHEITRYYFINSFPRLIMIDRKGKLFAFNANRPGDAAGNKALIDQIKMATQ